MLPLGTAAPDFALPDVTNGKRVSRDDYAQHRAMLVMFICRHCPFVEHVQRELAKLGRDYAGRGVGIVAISSNDAERQPDDAPPRLAEMAREQGFTFPLLYDETQAVARAYRAACTPDYFLFDAARRLAYRGQLDDSRPGNGVPVSGRDLRGALDAVLAGQPVRDEQRPSVGCSIKWKR
jgi:peroxiredoxin